MRTRHLEAARSASARPIQLGLLDWSLFTAPAREHQAEHDGVVPDQASGHQLEKEAERVAKT
jgi:hypothetical protein